MRDSSFRPPTGGDPGGGVLHCSVHLVRVHLVREHLVVIGLGDAPT